MYINILGIAKIQIEIEEAANVFYHGCLHHFWSNKGSFPEFESFNPIFKKY